MKIVAVCVTVALLGMFSAIVVDRRMESDCTRAGIQAGWATEAIKELCK